MINRALIRIKVVQMLYSYLLTRSEFKIEPAPDTTSRDRKYAYAVYLDLLLLILELSGLNVKNGSEAAAHPLASLGRSNPLAGSRLATSLAGDDNIREIILRGVSGIAELDPIVMRLHQTIVATPAFIDYKKIKKPELKDDVQFWSVILRTVIANNTLLQDVLRQDAAYTGTGFNRGLQMVLDTLNNYNDTRSMLAGARNSLDASLAKAYELYHAMLLLPVEITREEELRQDANKNKFLPTPEELNPNTRFVNNAFVAAIAESADMAEFTKKTPISWEADYLMVKDLLNKIVESDLYRDYMEAPSTDFAADCEFWRQVMKNIILPSDALADTLESKSVYWNDDLQIMGTFVLKTMRQFANSRGDKEVKLLPMYKDDDDAVFGPQLFIKAVDNRDLYRSYIDRFINREQWDSERLAFMDIVIMIAAITELLNFPSIPIPVTLNEYIEIANCYSTLKSGQFINGILFSVINCLKEEGLLNKE